METKSGRSSRVWNRSTSSSRLSGSDADLLLERMGAIQKNLHVGAEQENIGAVQENRWAVGAAQLETREVLETVIHRLERLEASPVPKFV